MLQPTAQPMRRRPEGNSAQRSVTEQLSASAKARAATAVAALVPAQVTSLAGEALGAPTTVGIKLGGEVTTRRATRAHAAGAIHTPRRAAAGDPSRVRARPSRERSAGRTYHRQRDPCEQAPRCALQDLPPL